MAHQSNVTGTVPPVGADRGAGARGRRAGAGRRRAVRAAPAGGRDRAGCRLPGLLRAQDARAVRHRRAVGPAASCWRRMPPFLTGGSMIEIVRMEGSTFLPPPDQFEAGVPAAAQAVGLAAACDYLDALGMTERRGARGGAHRARAGGAGRIDGAADPRPARRPGDRGGAVSFMLDGIHPHDAGQVLDDLGIAVRAGHHCAWPLHRALGVPSPAPGPRFTCTTPMARSTRWRTASGRRRSSSGPHDDRQEHRSGSPLLKGA